MQWITLIVGLLGGGLIVHFIEWYGKRGKCYIHDAKFILHYNNTFREGTISKITLDLLFVNTSGYSALITDLSVTFYVDSKIHPMKFVEYDVAPALVVKPNNVKNEQFKLIFQLPDTILLNDFDKEDGYYELLFICNKKQHNIKVKSIRGKKIDETQFVV